MGIEIERKFLVINDNWRNHIVKEIEITQSFLDSFSNVNEGSMQRVRIENINGKKIATLTIKSPKQNTKLSRNEWNIELPIDDGYDLIKNFSKRKAIEKTRFIVDYKDSLWMVDIFSKSNSSTKLIVAEIELANESDEFVLPNWVGKEVTEDHMYSNWSIYIRQPEK